MPEHRAQVDHTFVIPAYGESPYLEECMMSLKEQSVESTLLVTTSTPNAHIRALCSKHAIELREHRGPSSISSDWNAAYHSCTTSLLTLAHQDDVYYPNYTEQCLSSMRNADDALIVFSDYDELVAGKRVSTNSILLVKRIILTCFFGASKRISSRWRKRGVLSFGSPVSCPAVMFNTKNIGEFSFSDQYSINLDWDAWLRLAERPGSFVFTRQRGMSHRIYRESETSRGLQTSRRQLEDKHMFRALWPWPVSDILSALYTLSYGSNVKSGSSAQTTAPRSRTTSAHTSSHLPPEIQ